MLDFMNVRADPDFFLDTAGHHIMCELCGVRRACHVHHAEFKKMGGRKGASKKRIELSSNKKDICLVCHEAIHMIEAKEADGFCCNVCPNINECFYGSRLLNRPYEHLTAPF